MEPNLEQQIIDKVTNANLMIDFVDYGIASRIGDTIIFNKSLLDNPQYCLEVLDHEIRHSNNYTKKDLLMDLFEGSLFKNFSFMFKHPRAFSQLVPVGKYKSKWFIDVNQIITYSVMLVMGLIVWLMI